MSALPGVTPQPRPIQQSPSLLQSARAVIRERRRPPGERRHSQLYERYLAELRVEGRRLRLRRAGRPDARGEVS